jgi:hypothetical protein
MEAAMVISTYQPLFAPFLGFFYKARLSDVMVILDDVQFPLGRSFLNRNRFKNDQGILRITIPVWKRGRGLQKINQVMIYPEGNWRKKHLISLETSYANSPYFHEHLGFVEDIFTEKHKKLIDLNLSIIKYLMQQLDIATELILLSDLGITVRGANLLVEICRRLKASNYLTHTSARKFLNLPLFADAEIRISFFNPPSFVYPQLWGDFIPNLSAFDLLFNCGPKSYEILARERIKK